MKNIFKSLITMIVIILSTSGLSAQVAIQEDHNVIRIETPEGFCYVDSEGVYNGPYMMKTVYPDGNVLTVTGTKKGSKNVGRKIIKYNGQIVAIRVYDKNGDLVKSVRIKPEGYSYNLCAK